MEDSERIAKAWQITRDAGCASLEAYVAKEALWERSAEDQGLIVALKEKQSPDAITVLKALCLLGSAEIGDGYHAHDYLAGPEIKHEMNALYEAHKEARRLKEEKNDQQIYSSNLEYAACEFPWELSPTQGFFVVKRENIKPEQHLLLEDLRNENIILTRSIGQHRQDLVAGPELNETLKVYHALQEISSQPRSKGNSGRQH